MTKTKKFLLFAYLFVLFHTVKDFFQDFLETDFLYFLDANENLMVLPGWGRVALVLSNEAAIWLGIGLIIITPFILKKHLPLTFFSTPASQMKNIYQTILRQPLQ